VRLAEWLGGFEGGFGDPGGGCELVAPDQGQRGHDPEYGDHGADQERGREAVDQCHRQDRPRSQGILGARRGDRRERGNAERAADLLRGVDQARGEPGLGRPDAGQGSVKDSSPPDSIVIPTTSTGFTPSRVTSCAATADQTIAVPATAR